MNHNINIGPMYITYVFAEATSSGNSKRLERADQWTNRQAGFVNPWDLDNIQNIIYAWQ